MTMFSTSVFGIEQLTINSVDTIGPAWIWRDLSNLWIPTSTFANRVAPGVPGSSPLPGIQDELHTSLPFWISGTCDWEGNPYSDPYVGFRRNWRYLMNNVFLPPTAAYYEAVYQSPDADEAPITFPIQVVAPSISGRHLDVWEGDVAVIIPTGAL